MVPAVAADATATDEGATPAVAGETDDDSNEVPGWLAEYWADRIDEAASDILGILNVGPAAGIGLVGYFRGLGAAWAGDPTLRNDGPLSDPHPADILRGFLAAETVCLLSFAGAADWANRITDETRKDLRTIRVGSRAVSEVQAVASAVAVARTVVDQRLDALDGHSLHQIQDWEDEDESIARSLAQSLVLAVPVDPQHCDGLYAAHVVAAAATAALTSGANVGSIFTRMIQVLKQMHDANPSWGPLYIRHPGSLFLRRAR